MEELQTAVCILQWLRTSHCMPQSAINTIVFAVAVAVFALYVGITMSAPPASLDASPYDEAEILGLITDIYKVLIRQGHFNDKDVVWAPPEGHAIDLSVLDSPDDIDERVVSLMKKLPSGPDACVAPYMRPVSFLNPGELIRSRDIDKYMPGAVDLGRVDQTNALPTVLLLLSGWESTDPVLVLDVASSKSSCTKYPQQRPLDA